MRKYTHVRVIRAKAQTLAEYALILALIAILAIAVLKVLGLAIFGALNSTASGINTR